jgi:exopolysaccharide production protein ExoQ
MLSERTLARVLGVWALVVLTRPAYMPGYVAASVAVALIVALALVSGRVHGPRPALIAFSGLAWFSLGWSPIPGATFAGAVLITMAVFSGAAVARSLKPAEFLSMADLAFRGIILMSLALASVRPDLGLENSGPTAGSLVGIYPTRNVLGYVIVLGCVFLLLGGAKRTTKMVFGLLYVGALAWTGSQTSFVALLLAFSVGVITMRLKDGVASARAAALALGFAMASAAGVVLFQERSSFAASLGRDLSFSGRTDIWSLTIEMAGDRPWLGWGYGTGFSAHSPTGQTFYSVLGWIPPTAHNGFLNIYLELGLVGVALAGVVLLANAVRAVRALAQKAVPEVAPFATTILAVLLCVDLMENRMFTAIGIFLMSYIGVALNDARRPTIDQVPVRTRLSADA